MVEKTLKMSTYMTLQDRIRWYRMKGYSVYKIRKKLSKRGINMDKACILKRIKEMKIG